MQKVSEVRRRHVEELASELLNSQNQHWVALGFLGQLSPVLSSSLIALAFIGQMSQRRPMPRARLAAMPSEDANLPRDVRRLERPPGPGSPGARYYAEDIELEVGFQGGREDANATVLHGREQVRSFAGG